MTNSMKKAAITEIEWQQHLEHDLWLPVRADGADILHNVQDGVVRIKPDGTHKLEKHDPKWMFKGILPVNYGSKVRSRLYFDLLEKQLPDEKDRKLASLFEAY